MTDKAGLARFGALGPAEIVMVDGIGTGKSDRIGAGGLPDAGDETCRVRADLVRFLLLGHPDAPRMHEKGLRLSGAWITGVLDLEGCRVPRDIGLLDCRFERTPVLRSAIIDTLAFDGSDLPGFDANRLEARGDLLFRGATVRGPVSLTGSRIGGDLVLDGSTLDYAEGSACVAERCAVRGGVFLRGATVAGRFALPGARIGGDLDLTGATLHRADGMVLDSDSVQVEGDVVLRVAVITGGVSLVTAQVGGDVNLTGAQISHPGDMAAHLDRTVVKGALFLRKGARINGTLSLNGANLGAILDDPACWPAKGDLRLNRCLYGALLGGAIEARTRLDWLARQTPERWGEDFWPQPYEQLAAVLGQMGHDEDKRRVLVTKERLARRARRRRARNPLTRLRLALIDGLMGLTVGYGRKPLRAMFWILLIWVTGTGVYAHLDDEGALRPNAPVILRSPEWVLCATPAGTGTTLASVGQNREGLARPAETQLACYRRQPEASAYPKFNAAMLSADALLPGLGGGQVNYWSPDTRSEIGNAGKWFMYFQTAAGVALGLLAVAGFSGIVKTN
ncbi:hypothetical protein ACVDG3_17445 [Meridianimarinicoccus sp. RP-17]|uniref:hypothetical protein n=1 Tax=Meridianimarinicoccus zhengii TaxID=2056810 RepID=UPI000DABD62E|nr:hypothetical protein [Phycocomes zhengii]